MIAWGHDSDLNKHNVVGSIVHVSIFPGRAD